MLGKPIFAIIVPFKDLNEYVFECIEGCLGQSLQDFELILLPDNAIDKQQIAKRFGKQAMQKIRIIPTGSKLPPSAPSAKRNIGIENTKAEFLAFIDSDAYPQPQWLESALPLLRDPKVGAVGGPNLVPKNVGLGEEIAIKSMHLTSTWEGVQATGQNYKGFEVRKEFASSNILSKRKLLLEIGKFDVDFPTGEDMKLCAKIRENGKLILFNRETAVHHHNRTSLGKHLIRIKDFARGKIRVLKEMKEFRILNIAIIAFLFYAILAPFLIYASPLMAAFYAVTFTLYLIFIAADCLLHRINPLHIPLCIPFVFLTHLAYGFGSLQELFTSR